MAAAEKFTIEVSVREMYLVRPIMPPHRQVTIPNRVNELLTTMPSHEAAVKAGTMLLAMTDCEGFRIEKMYVRDQQVSMGGEPIMGELVDVLTETGEAGQEFINTTASSIRGANEPVFAMREDY
jgi:hypothetical protein